MDEEEKYSKCKRVVVFRYQRKCCGVIDIELKVACEEAMVCAL